MKAQTTRKLLLETGLRAMSVDGVSGVTLGRLASAAALSKSGLFAHFRSKQQLQIELLGEAARVAGAHVMESAMRAPEGLPRLCAVVERWLGWSARAGLPGGCPVAAAMFELDDVDGPVRAKVVALEAEGRAQLTALVNKAVAVGHLHRELDVEQFVWELFGIYLNHHATSRFLREPRANAHAASAIAGLLERSGAKKPVEIRVAPVDGPVAQRSSAPRMGPSR